MEHARREGDASPGVCGRNTGTAAYAVAHQVDRAAGLVAGKEPNVTDQSRLPPTGWVRLSKYCEVKGETRNSVNKRVRSGHWLKGVHLRRPEGSKELWVNLDAVHDWAAGKKPTHLHGKGAK